ncbi:hypothetical protein C8Q77DRAFT_887260 [Trametes polyzona]|nr:hypothetical protein C8Q77DRAFT_887260 [Trametes polyzona]
MSATPSGVFFPSASLLLTIIIVYSLIQPTLGAPCGVTLNSQMNKNSANLYVFCTFILRSQCSYSVLGVRLVSVD